MRSSHRCYRVRAEEERFVTGQENVQPQLVGVFTSMHVISTSPSPCSKRINVIVAVCSQTCCLAVQTVSHSPSVPQGRSCAEAEKLEARVLRSDHGRHRLMGRWIGRGKGQCNPFRVPSWGWMRWKGDRFCFGFNDHESKGWRK